jgi:hypothetical protein
MDIVAQQARRLNFDIMLSPGMAADPRLAEICDSPVNSELQAKFPFRIDPPTDDSPYFFQLAKLSAIFTPGSWSSIGRWTDTMQGLVILAALTVLLSILLLLCIYVPLQLRGPKFRSTKASLSFVLFFMSIGFGFMFLEISQMQRLSVFLGHPTYGLSVVLFSILIFSGIGSLASSFLASGNRLTSPLARMIVTVAVLIAIGFMTPGIMHNFESASLAVRIVTAICLLAPMGFFAGMALPTGMQLACREHGDMTSWFWAINGAASVLGSVLATSLSICSSISLTYFAACALYAVAAAALNASSCKQESATPST